VFLLLLSGITEDQIKVVRGKFQDIAEWNRMEALDIAVFKELVLKVLFGVSCCLPFSVI